MASNSGRIGKSRHSQSYSMPFDCQRMGSEHSYSLNSLWSIWYCTIAMAFQVYIIANSIKRFTLYLSLPWPNGQPPFSSLNAYVVLIGTGVVMLPFFVVVAMMKVGNYSNDGHKLGNQRKTCETNNIYQNIKITEKELQRKKRFHGLKLIWRHSAPIAPVLHMLAALCFLIPRILMEAQLIKHGFLGKGDIWKTEIDFILNRLEDKKISILSFLNTISDSERNELNLETYSLNQYLTKQSSNLVKQYDVHIEESGHLSMELINFGIALFVLAVRYPSVFWKVHKGFGFFFSIQLIINLIQSLIIYSGFQVAFKVLVCDPNLVLVRFKSATNLTPFQLSAIFILYIILMTFSSTPLYMYGLSKYREWRSSQSRRMHITLKHQKQRFCGYFAHFWAFIVLIILSLCVLPLFYEFIMIYAGSLDSCLLIAIIATTIHLLLWIILWLFLTIKNKWSFNMTFDFNDYENKYSFNERFDRKSMSYTRGETPLLVIENGKTYQIRETASKRAILGVAHKSHITQKQISPAEDEDIYWLKPKLSTPNKVLNKESPEEDSSMTWLKNDKKSNNKVSFEDQNNSIGSKGKKKSKKSPKNTLKSKKSKNCENGIDLDQMSDHSDGDYATLRRIITNDIENSDLTHLNLCPLRNESIEIQKSEINPTRDGDYEVLVDTSYSTTKPNYSTNNMTTNVVYSTNICQNMTSTPLTVAAHFGREEHITDQLTPRSGSISETSTSPEKNSDTSSGVHSNSSNGTNCSPAPSALMDKRSNSMESLMNQIQAAAAAKPSFRSLSLQRYMSSLSDQTNNTIPQRMSSFNECDHKTDHSMVIRRAKRPPQRTSEIFNMNSTGTPRNDTYYGRDANYRMTSFTENPEYMKFHSMPAQPKMVPIPAVPNTHTLSNEYSRQTYTDMKTYLPNSLNSHVITGTHRPVVSIAPQVMTVNGSHNFLQQREPTNYSFVSQSNPTAPVSQLQTT